MALHLSASVTAFPGIGPAATADLRNLDIICVRDLLLHFPYRYEDYTYAPGIAHVRHDQTVTITARVRDINTRPSKTNRHLKLTEAVLEDETGSLKAMWFNQPYLEKTLKPGTTWAFAGRVDAKFGAPTLMNPVHEPVGIRVQTGRLVPVYGLSGSLTERKMRVLIASALRAAVEFTEWLPEDLCKNEELILLSEAMTAIHAPESKTILEAAITRLKFDELFLHQLMFAAVREQRKTRPAHAIPIDEAFLKTFVGALPFTLTQAQRRATWDVVKDCAEASPMNRLLEGDVGSGKTVVAAIAIAHTIHTGERAAYLAPTEILATQQQAALVRLIPKARVALLTGSRARLGTKDVSRAELVVALEAGDIDCLVGTHALIQQGLPVPKLGLVVVDEQHRFGVEQRHALLGREGEAPHLLSMTATPIPRSLALTLYGDLDVSILNERPVGRRPIVTRLLTEAQASVAWKHILTELESAHQAYVVCPLIDPSDASGSASVSDLANTLKKGPFKGKSVGILHGKLKADEKADVLNQFREGKIHVLVSTTVVEVGVDVPNATSMVIMAAERFGLAQLHQLRGRVGRSDLASACFLVSGDGTRAAKERLEALVACADGFILAEKDLLLRGSGNVFGDAQSGFPDFKLATVADVPLMRRAHFAAQKFLASDPDFSRHPAVKERVNISFDEVHLE